METKYLSDGRKVAVIGQLNNVESIVQEVFVSESGDQIPSGEKFTTKSLHDEPVKSWKEKRTEEYEARYETAENEIKTIEKELRLMKSKRQAHSDLLQANDNLVNVLDDCDLEYFADVITGNIKWVCPNDWGWDSPTLFEDKIYQWSSSYGDKSYEGIKMMSVFGYSNNYHNRKFRITIGQYYDGSGSESKFEFFKTDDDLGTFLTEKYKKAYEKGNLTTSEINNISKFIKVDQKIIDDIIQREVDRNKKSFDDELTRVTDNFDKRVIEINKMKIN